MTDHSKKPASSTPTQHKEKRNIDIDNKDTSPKAKDKIDNKDQLMPATAKKPRTQGKLVTIGIGASAGGLEALRALIPSLPVQNDITYVIAQHLDPRHSTMLGSILERDTDMPIQEVSHNQSLKPGVLHIIPPGKDAYLKGVKIYLQKASGIGPKPSINRFFVSMAEECGESAVGIILSGTGTDGAHGIHTIKAEGGITIAQDEKTAKFPSMPHAAISTGHVDLVLAPEKIGVQLPELIRYPRAIPEMSGMEEMDSLSRILQLVFSQTGSDFRDYKMTTINRRIERRMAVHKLFHIGEYVDLLENHPEECAELHQDILISVTAFFRDNQAFNALNNNIRYLVQNSVDEEIRIWVPACATGEEAYSLAILLLEHLGNRINKYKLKIFATDLDKEALVVARQGIYPRAVIENIDDKLLNKYFTHSSDTWQVNADVRDMIMFAKHSLVKDPPFSHIDLISCRNLLIYFNNSLQKRILQTFHYALNNNGLLFLGKSETIGANERLFNSVDMKNRLYKKRGEIRPELPYISPLTSGKKINSLPSASSSSIASVTPEHEINQLLADINQQDCVLLDDNLEITYVRGNITPFMMFTEGRVELNVCNLVHSELRHDLRALLYKAKRAENEAVKGRQLRLDIGEKSISVQMVVKSLNDSESTQSYILIFNHHPINLEDENGATSDPLSQQDKLRIKALEDELKESNESLQTTIEELETSNEELQSTYEEAQSTNEELYTSTEELQTSNEELQSTNEELRTVNEEVAIKNDEIEATNAKILMINTVLEKEIEERKLAEQLLKEQKDKLRTIIDSEPAWVNVCNNKGVIMEVNPAGVEIMEAASKADLMGKKLIDLVTTEDKNELLSCQDELQQGEIRKHSVEATTLQGNMRWLEISTVLLPDALDDDFQMMSIICDQTQFKKAQNTLIKRQEELNQLMRINTLGAMATGLAHELNQPLAAIGNYLSGCENLIAQEGCDRDEIRSVLKLANQQLQRTGDIVRQIRGFVEQDKEQQSSGEMVNLNDCINYSIKMLRSTGFFNQVEVILELEKQLPPVQTSHVQIEQVIINLLMNALESMEGLAPDKKSLEVHSLLSDDSHVEVQIKDRGTGMSDEQKQEVFKPFHTTKEKGMGMGLCICHTIIELHTGQMKITDRKGGGTTFSFILPIYKKPLEGTA